MSYESKAPLLAKNARNGAPSLVEGCGASGTCALPGSCRFSSGFAGGVGRRWAYSPLSADACPQRAGPYRYVSRCGSAGYLRSRAVDTFTPCPFSPILKTPVPVAPSAWVPLELIHGYVSTRFQARHSPGAQDRQACAGHQLHVHGDHAAAPDQHRTFVSGQDFAEAVSRDGIDSAAQLEAGTGTDQSGEAGGEAEAASSRAGFRTAQADRSS